MNTAKYLSIFILLTLSGTAMAAKIENLIDVQVPTNIDGSSPSKEEVREAIISGCKKKNWIPVIDDNGNIVCSITVRSRHFAEVEISYTTEKFSIVYKSSRGLDYNEKKQRIHRNYNKWVYNLSDSIQRQFSIAG